MLTANQRVGLKYYEDFLEKMPRAEATKIFETVEAAAKKLFGENVIVNICGSYRRGRQTCGDVDILITRSDNRQVRGMLERLVVELEDQGFLKERLSLSATSVDKAKEMYMGVCKVRDQKNALARRIDIKVYPKEQYGYAILYFTGSDYFNRSMRLFADKKGYTLSDHGMVPNSKASTSG